jgi:hypothetical protein
MAALVLEPVVIELLFLPVIDTALGLALVSMMPPLEMLMSST